jgi:uncharacterized Zn finger protein
MEFKCSCPDWADMCKHVAAVMYGVGWRFDSNPDLVFLLRGVNPADLIVPPEAMTFGSSSANPDELGADQLAGIFGVDLGGVDPSASVVPEPPTAAPAKSSEKKAAAKGPKSPPSAARKSHGEQPTAKEVRQLRKAMKLNIEEFAARLGVAVATAIRWEDSKVPLKLQRRTLDAYLQLKRETPTPPPAAQKKK